MQIREPRANPPTVKAVPKEGELQASGNIHQAPTAREDALKQEILRPAGADPPALKDALKYFQTSREETVRQRWNYRPHAASSLS